MMKHLISTALNHDTVQQVFERLGSKMDFTAGVSVAALTFGSTAAFVKYESSNMRDDVKKLASNLRQDIKQLDLDIRKLDSQMDQLLFHMVGIPSKPDSKVCRWCTYMAVCIYISTAIRRLRKAAKFATHSHLSAFVFRLVELIPC